MDVSVVIPVYNGAAFIAEAVESALAQEGVAQEIIVVDDGSTDGTRTILEKYRGRIRYEYQPRTGYIPTRNRGGRLATGEWLAFLDADDVWSPAKLAAQLARAERNTALVYTDRFNFGACGFVAPLQSASVQQFEGDIFEPLLLNNFITLSSVILRKCWFEALGGFVEDLGCCEDWDMWLRLAAARGQVKLAPQPLTGYRWHPGSISKNHRAMKTARVEVIRRALQSPAGRRVSLAVAARARANAWACSAWHAAEANRLQACGWYLRAACHWPWELSSYKGALKCVLGRP